MIKIKAKTISLPKLLLFCLVAFVTMSVPTVTWADSGWAVSITQLDQAGYFDYTLYYPYSEQVISKVSLAQNQGVKLLKVKHGFANQRDFISFLYGGAETGFKGKGSDSDWTIAGSDSLTDFGVLDIFGGERIYGLDLGTVLYQNQRYQAELIMGWVQQETTNEFRNIVYHLINGVESGPLPQADNGSYLDGEFEGLVFGLNQGLRLSSKLLLTTGIEVSLLSAKAYGHWANHDPAWNWENTGRALGYGVDLGLQYAFDNQFQAEIGYGYYHTQADGCKEILNGYLLSQVVDLELEQHGFYAALMVLF